MSVTAGHTIDELHTPLELLEIAPAWNELAAHGGSPFLTTEWLTAWWNAFGARSPACVVLRDRSGRLRAGACFRRSGRRLAGMANEHSGDWDGVAVDEEAREALWQQIATLGSDAVVLPSMLDRQRIDLAQRVLRSAGYTTALIPAASSPFLKLPASWDELLGNVGRKLRHELGRKRRMLEREGKLVFRTTTGGERLGQDLRAMFAVEASGWKSRSRTAILSSPVTTKLYEDFANGLARAGWLRLHLLELDGRVIAADLECAFAWQSFLIKTGFDERFAHFSPGLVLRGEALRASIEQHAASYDFLGGPDSYKLRWRAELRPRQTVRAFKGWRRPSAAYYRWLRPPLRAAVLQVRDSRSGGR